MLNHKGSTLIESLLAFEIFISVLILLVSLLTHVYGQEKRVLEKYQNILEKEESLSSHSDFIETIEMVLH